jgi:hypothetical protein
MCRSFANIYLFSLTSPEESVNIHAMPTLYVSKDDHSQIKKEAVERGQTVQERITVILKEHRELLKRGTKLPRKATK